MIYFEDKIIQNDEITSTSYFAYPDMSLLYVENMGKKKIYLAVLLRPLI